MKRYIAPLFFLFIFAGLSLFFFFFASYLFDRQEEMQLFIPEWSIIGPQLTQAGSLYKILGMYCTQFFCYPLPAALINAFFVAGTGFTCYLLLQHIAAQGYNFILSLLSVFLLIKVHIRIDYGIGGTIAYLIMLLLLLLIFNQTSPKRRVIYGIAGTIIVYWMAGHLTLLYAFLYIVYEYLYTSKKTLFPLIIPFIGFGLFTFGIYSGGMLPLTDDIYGKVWSILTVLLIFLFILSRLLRNVAWKKKSPRWLINTVLLVALFVFSGFCLPDKRDKHDRMIYQLDYFARRQNWDAIIAIHMNKRVDGVLHLNYINMALAQKGVLGNRMFYFGQKGAEGLLKPYDFTYFSSILLSDIHFQIGDISLSESYAMEALTLAPGKGSPRAMKRLVEISLIRNEWELANKYISLLKRMPVYREWALRYESYLGHPEKIKSDPVLAGKSLPDKGENMLLSMVEIRTLWMNNLQQNPDNRVVYEYLGCYYLLNRQIERFKDFILQTTTQETKLPIHFQEAALVVFEDGDLIPESIQISSAVRQRYNEFMNQLAKTNSKQHEYELLYKQYGDTFWFYYNMHVEAQDFASHKQKGFENETQNLASLHV